MLTLSKCPCTTEGSIVWELQYCAYYTVKSPEVEQIWKVVGLQNDWPMAMIQLVFFFISAKYPYTSFLYEELK